MKKILNTLAFTGALLFAHQSGVAQTTEQSPGIPVITEIKIKPGEEAAVKKACEKLRKEVRSEPDNLEFAIFTKEEDPGTLIIFEIFKNADAVQAHKNEPHTISFLESIKGKYVEDDVTFFSVPDDE